MNDERVYALHDLAAHKHDSGTTGWPTCPRCIELCVQFHDAHGIGHLIPDGLRRTAAI
jgi:hypothetical protein